MKNKTNEIKEIEAYLSGVMNAEDIGLFRKKINEDKKFRKVFETYMIAHGAAKKRKLDNAVQDILEMTNTRTRMEPSITNNGKPSLQLEPTPIFDIEDVLGQVEQELEASDFFKKMAAVIDHPGENLPHQAKRLKIRPIRSRWWIAAAGIALLMVCGWWLSRPNVNQTIYSYLEVDDQLLSQGIKETNPDTNTENYFPSEVEQKKLNSLLKLLQNQRYREVIPELEAFIRDFPENYMAYYFYAKALVGQSQPVSLGNLDKAIDALKIIIEPGIGRTDDMIEIAKWDLALCYLLHPDLQQQGYNDLRDIYQNASDDLLRWKAGRLLNKLDL